MTGLRHGARVAARAAARRVSPTLLRVARSDDGRGPVFGQFERDGGERVALFAEYRNSVKASWLANWWSVQALIELRARGLLRRDLVELVEKIELGRTLPMSVAELTDVVAELQRENPSEVRATGRYDDLGAEVLEIVPRRRELERKAAAYRATAQGILAAVAGHAPRSRRRKVLDAGTGSGYLAFALAGVGGADVVGLDLDPESYAMPTERARMRELLLGESDGSVRLERGDVHELEFPDGVFDLVCSMTAVEHFADLERSVAELARVLRPGGLMVHGVEPWFSKLGGHGLCTLDFPWGHVRLAPQEMARYLEEVRPHEAETALRYYRTGFQQAPATLAQSLTVFSRALEVLEWREVETRALDAHRAFATSAVLADCRRRFPGVTRRDLLVLTYTVVARRPR
jgi:SAM-dependent methyltransferase